MEWTIALIVGMFILIMSLLDIWKKSMPSILPTTVILALAIINHHYFYFGIIGFIYAWLLYEFGLYRGVADIKVIVIISLMLTSLNQFFALMTMIPLASTCYYAYLQFAYGLKKGSDIPYVPVLFIVYVALVYMIMIL